MRAEHTPQAIAARLTSVTRHSYLGDGVLGAIDGTVTTFALVAGALGAGISERIALVLGLANVFADGFSMALGNYMRSKADRQVVERAREMEEHHIDTYPDGEREEIRQLFSRKGFEGPVLDKLVEVITGNREQWVDTMLTEELGLQLRPPVPVRAGLTTFFSFLAAGSIPLLPLLLLGGRASFDASILATAVTFITIGLVKGKLTAGSLLGSAFETFLVGGVAAALAYFVGAAAKSLLP